MQTVLLFFGENRTPLVNGAPVPRRFRPRARFASETSDAPCRVLRRFGNPTQRRARTASPTPSSMRAVFPAQSAFHRQMPSGVRFRNDPKARHRFLDFAVETRLPTCFRLAMLSHAEARPHAFTAGSSPAGANGPRAACRLLQSIRSTSTTVGSIEPRAPHHQSPAGAAPIAGGYAFCQLGATLSVATSLRAASRDAAGQGPCVETEISSAWLL